MPKLTKAIIDYSSPKEKNYIVWDTEIKGFGCQILKSGSKKTYVFYYWSPLTKKKGYVKIGCHGNITVDFARNAAKKLAAAVASGIDPKKEKEEKLTLEKQSILFRDFFEDFKTKHILVAYKDQGRNNMGYAKSHILPYFGQRKLDEISSKDIRSFLDSLAHISTTANRCFALLSMAFKKAEDWEYLPPRSNPCTGVNKYKENKKQRFLSDAELKRLENSLIEQQKLQPASYCTVNAIFMILYTGCRVSEILNLKWENVHLSDSYIHLPDTKTGEGARPLNQKAIDLLSSMTPKEGNPYVFYGKVPGQPIVEIKRAWGTILKRADIKDFRIHDLRHSFASFALKKGVPLVHVSKLLGHRNIATTMRYAHLELEQLKESTNIVNQVFG
ncbi:MAG: site-specific integrase [Alphaproteobacteria bacterium]|nr:site-specific integrase [Alphaproteobacteria bacterium]